MKIALKSPPKGGTSTDFTDFAPSEPDHRASGRSAQAAGASAADRMELGRLANGATVAFVRAGPGDWGIEISGGTAAAADATETRADRGLRRRGERTSACRRLPVREEGSRRGCGDGEGGGRRPGRVCRRGPVEGLRRRVVAQPEGERDRRGAQRRVLLGDPAFDRAHGQMGRRELSHSGPALRQFSYAGGGAPSSAANYRAKRFSIREDYLSAPLFGALVPGRELGGGAGPGAAGDTTQAETTASAATPIIDERIQFGALGARKSPAAASNWASGCPAPRSNSGGGFGRSGGQRTRRLPWCSVAIIR